MLIQPRVHLAGSVRGPQALGRMILAGEDATLSETICRKEMSRQALRDPALQLAPMARPLWSGRNE